MGREAGKQTAKAWERELGDSGSKRRHWDAERGPGARGTRLGRAAAGGEARVPSLLSGAGGTSFLGNPHPGAPNLENKGSGKHGRGRGAEVQGGRKAGGGGRGGRLATFPLPAE